MVRWSDAVSGRSCYTATRRYWAATRRELVGEVNSLAGTTLEAPRPYVEEVIYALAGQTAREVIRRTYPP
jgi:GAF domain-containing protein